MKALVILTLILTISGLTSASWDANLHLIRSIQNGEFRNFSQQLMKLEGIINQNIISTICGFFPDDQSVNPKTFLPELFEDEEPDNSLQYCFVQSLEVIQQACHGELWPIIAIDSWAKIQSGFLSGNIRNPGAFSQCIKINAPIANEFAGGPFVGKHCNMMIGKYVEGSLNISALPELLQMLLPEDPIFDIGGLIPDGVPLFVDFGICVPKVCSNELVLLITRVVTYLVRLGPTETFVDNMDKFCNTDDVPPLGAMEWGAISLIIIGFVGIILSTIYEVICVKLKATPNEGTAAMSLYSNGKYLFTMRQKKDHMQALHGIRALALIWLMLGYRFIIPLIMPLINPLDFVMDFMDSYFAPWIFASQFGTDALLFANATLIAYLFMCKMQKSGHVKIWKLYIFRLMRVTPFIGILIFFMMTLTPYQSSGPYYRFLTEAQIPACEEYWWSAMFHLQNYVNPDTLCILHTYIFSIDMQLFWAAPILLFPLYFFGPLFLLFVILVFLLSIACAATVSYYYGFQAFIVNNVLPFEKVMQYLRMIVFPTHVRMGPWLVGIMCGYIVYRLKDGKRRINWFISAFFWILSISGIIAVVYLLYPFHQLDHIIDNTSPNWWNYIYIGFARNVFALCLGWFVIGSYTGTGGVLSWFLSLSIWQPLSKMSISIYIVSLSAQMVMVSSWKTPYVFGISEMLQAFQGDLLIVFLFSCMTFLMLERPIVRTMKYILRIGQNKEEDDGIIKVDEQLKFEQQASPWKSFY